jgi:hypothetical protein
MPGRSWRVEVRTEAPAGVGQYLALDNGTVDGGGWYLGLQTDLHHPERGAVGPGLIFSSWASRTAADIRVAPGGYAEIGAHEGGFVGVRLPLRLTEGRWQVTLARSGPASWSACGGDAFALTATTPDGTTVEGGTIAFPRVRPGTPATIDPGGTGFWELYAGADRPEAVPRWQVGVMAFDLDGGRCPAGAVSYPRFPDRPPFEAVDAAFDAATGLVEIRAGEGVTTVHPPGRWR